MASFKTTKEIIVASLPKKKNRRTGILIHTKGRFSNRARATAFKKMLEDDSEKSRPIHLEFDREYQKPRLGDHHWGGGHHKRTT